MTLGHETNRDDRDGENEPLARNARARAYARRDAHGRGLVSRVPVVPDGRGAQL